MSAVSDVCKTFQINHNCKDIFSSFELLKFPKYFKLVSFIIQLEVLNMSKSRNAVWAAWSNARNSHTQPPPLQYSRKLLKQHP